MKLTGQLFDKIELSISRKLSEIIVNFIQWLIDYSSAINQNIVVVWRPYASLTSMIASSLDL